MKRVYKILLKLLSFGVYPEYSDPHFDPCVDWREMPSAIDPTGGHLDPDRARRKRHQIENIIFLAKKLISDGDVVVDFCSGSGHVSLPMAYLFPKCHFILVERNKFPVQIARERILSSGLKNVELFNGYVEDFKDSFDLGIALHACGDATDKAQIKCIENRAPYILCPCDLGYIKNSKMRYPRSKMFSKLINREEYDKLAQSADWTCWDFESEKSKIGKLSMGYVSTDRNCFASEFDYETYLFTAYPKDSTPKNDILFGLPKNSHKIEVFERFIMYLGTVIKPDQLSYFKEISNKLSRDHEEERE